MQELFWFFLGGLFYLIINKFISFYHKVKFISDIKIHSFKLIGFALEQLMFAMAAKYIALQTNPNFDKEKIKLLKNDDEATFTEWKKTTVIGLKGSLPPHYDKALEIDDWSDLMDILDKHYKKALDVATQEPDEHA